MNPKFILVTEPGKPLAGTFVYGMVYQHKDLVSGYVKVHGGGWYHKDDEARTMTLYGSSGDYGPPRFAFLNRIPSELKGYRFIYTYSLGLPGNELPLEDVEWI